MIAKYGWIFFFGALSSQMAWAEVSPLDDSSLSTTAGGDIQESAAHKDHAFDKNKAREEINEVRKTLRKSHGGTNANWKRSNRRRINTLLDSSVVPSGRGDDLRLPDTAAKLKNDLPKPDGSGVGDSLRSNIVPTPPGK